MAFWLCCWWSFIWTLLLPLRNVSTDSSLHTKYTVSQSKVAFDWATSNCLPGVLPKVATEHELQEILQLLNGSQSFEANITFWIGLRKPREECVSTSGPLRGFKWVENASQELSAIGWMEEPKLTCTEHLCGGLRQQFVHAKVTWGLIPDSCRTPYQFICKGSDGQAQMSLESPLTTVRPFSAKPQPKTATAETSVTTSEPDPTTPHPKIPTSGPESCEHSENPKHPSIRSLTPDSSDSSKVLVECWSEEKMELICSGVPALWRVLDGSPANFSLICQKCKKGFQKGDSGLCVDIDECSTGSPCQHTCQNTEGSYQCVCADDQDSTCEDAAPANKKMSLSHVLIPVLAIVGLLLVILAIVVVVKCCLKRRKRKMKTKP